MTLKTGSSKRRAGGFTMIELMIAAMILGLGTLLLNGGFMKSADLHGRYSNTLKAMLWADQKIWETRETLIYTEEPQTLPSQGSFVQDGKRFGWAVDIRSLSEQDLYSILVTMNWNEGNRPTQFKRESYAAKIKPPQA
jgi:prepilin-type N-terminal cleavage/methylation domain-containing protein